MKLLKKLALAVVIFSLSLSVFHFAYDPIAMFPEETYMIREAYNLPDNTVDVAVVGSCQVYRGFNPAILWQTQKISSYCLASPHQKPYTSYYLLKNFLRKQAPKVVLFDPLMLFLSGFDASSLDLQAQIALPYSIDRWALSDASFCSNYPDSKAAPKFFFDRIENMIYTAVPMQFFVSRQHMQAIDYEMQKTRIYPTAFCGATPTFIRCDVSSMSNYMNEPKEFEQLDPEGLLYFDKLYQLCKENDITLVLFKTVSPLYWNNTCSELTAALAAQYGLDYIDYNIDYARYGFDLSYHMDSTWKYNADGTQLSTILLGEYLVNTFPSLLPQENVLCAQYYDQMTERYENYYAAAEWSSLDP